jgi:hypothetical protein
MCTHHEQATPRKAGKPPAHQFPEPSLYPVAHHRRANRTANYKAYLRPGVLGYRTGGQQHMHRQGRAASPPTRPHHALELVRAPHPRLLRQHDPSKEAKARLCHGHGEPPPVAAKPNPGIRVVVPRVDTADHGEGGRRPPSMVRRLGRGTSGESDRRSLTRANPVTLRPQTASCSRPLRRRAARTARPARVRIRSRKPWTFARRRLFGWNVRLLTGTPGRWGNCPRSRADMSCAARSRHGSAC